MKAKYLLLTIFWVGILSACTNVETFKDVLYFTGTEDSPAVKYTIDGPAEIGVTVSASCQATSDQTIRVRVDRINSRGIMHCMVRNIKWSRLKTTCYLMMKLY